nr:hypothetical protein [Streptomyces sp. A1-5]
MPLSVSRRATSSIQGTVSGSPPLSDTTPGRSAAIASVMRSIRSRSACRVGRRPDSE